MARKFDNSLFAVFSQDGTTVVFAFTCLAVKQLSNLAVKRSTGVAVHELSS